MASAGELDVRDLYFGFGQAFARKQDPDQQSGLQFGDEMERRARRSRGYFKRVESRRACRRLLRRASVVPFAHETFAAAAQWLGLGTCSDRLEAIWRLRLVGPSLKIPSG